MTAIPNVGDRHTFKERRGYVLYQDRPFACRFSCTCGSCNGVVTEHPSTITEVIHWMDNSVEIVGLDSQGQLHRETLIPPHGDAC